jgi:hypothetical protein
MNLKGQDMTYIPLPEFKIENHLDRLIPVENQKDRWYCPCCHNKNFTFNPEKGWGCWNGCTSAEVMAAIRPLQEAIAESRQQQGRAVQHSRKPPLPFRPKTPQPAQLPETISLAWLAEPATDTPQPRNQLDARHGEVQVWRFDYSDRQWVERIQWADTTQAKGYDKDYYPYHLPIAGEQVPLKQGRKTIGFRPSQLDEIICGSGSESWTAYRLDEAIAAAQASSASAILLAEGEPCVETYRSLGLAAITLPGSGWSKGSIAALVERLRTAELMLIGHPDHDKTGYQKAEKLAAACAAAGVPYLQLDPTALDPEIQEHGDVQNMLTTFDADDYQQRLAAEIQRQIELRRQLDRGNFDPPFDGRGGGGDGKGGHGGDEGFSDNHWNAPVSWQSEIGIWVKDKDTEELWFRPCCNFDFQVIRELISEDGGGIEITLKRSFDPKEKQIFIESVAYTNPEKFVDAVKKALGSGIVCTLSKTDLSALIHTRLRDYHQRGGKTYRLAERRGRQDDGTWVFESCQFKPDGSPTDTEASGWVYTEVFPNCEDIIPSPVIALHDPTILRRYLQVKQRAFGRNFAPSLLLDGWVVAGIFDAEIVAKERSFPLINPYGDAGGFKSFAAESSLALLGFSKAETMLSKVSESALFEWLKRLSSIPVILDDPKREAGGIDIEEVAKRAYNRFARVVRGNRQEPRGGLAITSNHLIGEKNSATRSRIIPLFFPVLPESSYDKAAFSELLEVRELVSGCFPDLLKLGYNAQAVKQLEEVFHQHLPAAHARTAKSLAIATHYALAVVRLAGLEGEIDIQQWVIETLCPLCNESQAGLSSVADFAEHLDVLESRALVGEWCKTEVQTEKYGICIAMHLPTVWKEFDREFNPSYNRSVLEQVLLERGAIKNQVAKFWADRDQTLTYKRQIVIAGINGDAPKEPERVARKCLLIPEDLWETLFKGHSAPQPPLPTPSLSDQLSYLPVTPVTSSYLEQVTGSKADAVSDSTVQNQASYPVTFKKEDQELEKCDRSNGIDDLSNLHSGVTESEVTEVTATSEVFESPVVSTVQPVTWSELPQVTEGGEQVTELPSEAIAAVSSDAEPNLLDAGTLRLLLAVLAGVSSLRSVDRFKRQLEVLTDAQQRQLWTAASPELQAQYCQWLDRWFEVPETVWAARRALLGVVTVPQLQAVYEQFDAETLNQGWKLLGKQERQSIKALSQWITKL